MDDYSAPVAMAGRRNSQQAKTYPHGSLSNESGVCCEVCQKTKFVGEQSARQCSICKKRFCVRCGVRLKGHQHNKVCRNCPLSLEICSRVFCISFRHFGFVIYVVRNKNVIFLHEN